MSDENQPKAKRMMEYSHEGDRILVSINSSSLEIIQTCKRKALYYLAGKYRSEKPSEALTFGSAIHKGLESWYLNGRNDDAGITAFVECAKPLAALHEKDKRHPNNGIKILKNYFQVYKDDPYEILMDEQGKPYIERDFEFELLKTDNVTINLFGTIDCIFKHKDTGEIVIADHKTTSSLGQEFYNRLSPNNQYTTYIMAAQTVFGLNTDRFLVNGIQVAKTKWDLSRQFTTRSEQDITECRGAYYAAVREFLACTQSGFWPMSAPSPCSNWGGCMYREVCDLPANLRQDMLDKKFPKLGEQQKTMNEDQSNASEAI